MTQRTEQEWIELLQKRIKQAYCEGWDDAVTIVQKSERFEDSWNHSNAKIYAERERAQ